MKLNYKILWIDDQIETYIEMGIKSDFESFLENMGFIAHIEPFENGKLAKESIDAVKYDLILSDYNIEGVDEQGDVLIRTIREGGIFTEVLFYSAQENFDEIARNLYQDRVSFFSLVGDEGMRGFKEKTKRLIEQTISKIQELNNIRGLVMSETSELDNAIEDILLSFLSINNAEAQTLHAYIIAIIKESAESNLKAASKLDGIDDNTALVKARIFDADKKARALNRLLEITGLDKEDHFKMFYTNYKSDVLEKRNDLAHAKSDIIDGTEYLILSRKDGVKPEKYDQHTCIQIRKNLRKYSSILNKIHSEVSAS